MWPLSGPLLYFLPEKHADNSATAGDKLDMRVATKFCELGEPDETGMWGKGSNWGKQGHASHEMTFRPCLMKEIPREVEASG